jgi:hypothetical protein
MRKQKSKFLERGAILCAGPRINRAQVGSMGAKKTAAAKKEARLPRVREPGSLLL